MTSFDEAKTTTDTIPTAHGDTVPLAALEAADRYARGSESLIEQARRLIGQMRDDVALARNATDHGRTELIGRMNWRLCSLGYVMTAIEEEYMR
jgi:hypothetical protein